MNKGDLIAQVRLDAGLSRRQAAAAVDAVLDAVRGAVSRGERVTIPDFGTFEQRERASRTARNPRTGERVRVPATWVPVFRPGQAFKHAVLGRSRVQRRSRRRS